MPKISQGRGDILEECSALFLGASLGVAVGHCGTKDGLELWSYFSSGNLALNGHVFFGVAFLSFMKSLIHVKFQVHSKHNWGNSFCLALEITVLG